MNVRCALEIDKFKSKANPIDVHYVYYEHEHEHEAIIIMSPLDIYGNSYSTVAHSLTYLMFLRNTLPCVMSSHSQIIYAMPRVYTIRIKIDMKSLCNSPDRTSLNSSE